MKEALFIAVDLSTITDRAGRLSAVAALIFDHVVGPRTADRPDNKRAARSSNFSSVSGSSRWASNPALHVRTYATGSRIAVSATSPT